jgi:hypothetical protein
VVKVSGSGFTEEMQVVLGRGTRAVPLDSELTEDGRLVAQLPPDYLGLAEDLFVAVLSADSRRHVHWRASRAAFRRLPSITRSSHPTSGHHFDGPASLE